MKDILDNIGIEKIVPVGNGKYIVQSEKGKNLSKELSFDEANARLKEIEMFKHMKKNK